MSQPAKPSQRSPILLKQKDNSRQWWIAGGIALGVGGAAIAGWFLTRPPLDKVLPTGSQVLPPNVLMTLSVSTDPAQWQQLRSLGTQQSRVLFDRALADWRDRLFTDQGLDYGRDIQPWVGSSVTLALLPKAPTTGAESTSVAGTNLPIVGVIPVANPIQAVQSLRTSQDRGGAAWKERDYNGYKLRERQGDKGQSMAVTVIDNRFIVFAFDAKLLEQVVDTLKSGITLKDAPGYQSAWGALHEDKVTPFAHVFVNVPMAASAAAASSAVPVKPENFAQSQQNQGFVLAATVVDQIVTLKGLSWLKPDSKRRLAVYNNARLMPSLLPTSTYMFLSGGNLKQIWQDYDQGTNAESNPLAPVPPARLRDGLKALAGLDFDQDVLSWMGGEYALALIATPETQSARNTGTGIALFAQASDRRGGEQFFQKLDQAATQRYQFQTKEEQVQGQTVTAWLDKDNRLIASHGWLDNNVAFLTAGAPVRETFFPKPTEALANSAGFTQAIPSGLNPNNGHFYLDITKTVKNPMPNLPFLPSGNPILQAIESIGVTAAVRDEQSTRFDVQVRLKKEGGNLPFPAPGTTPTPETQVSPSP